MTVTQKLIFASRNKYKTEEISELLQELYQVSDLNDTDFEVVEETGSTFLENATLKAVTISKSTDSIVLSDDSGIEVDALAGAPGVYSSSYGGEEGNHTKNNIHMMNELEKLPEDSSRIARFRCVMVLAHQGEVIYHCVGSVEGRIINKLTGDGGFGYDPLFIPEGYNETFAQLGSNIKNTMSHRGRALQKIIKFLVSLDK